MGDDPYDFDIAIPSGRESSHGGGKRCGWGTGGGGGGTYSSGASDSDGGSSGGEDSVIHGNLSDSDEERFRPTKKENAQAKSTAVRGGGVAQTKGGGSSALDKAKSFLSKYSSKATTSTPVKSSGRSRCLEMSSDDDEFSLDSSGEVVKTSAPPRKTVTKPASSSGSEDDDGDHQSLPDGDESASVIVEKPTVVVESTRKSQEAPDDEQAHVMPSIMVTPSVVATTWRPNNVDKASVSVDDDEVESIASQSDVDDSVEIRKPTSVSVRATVGAPAVLIAASESGVYEDEGFEDMSTDIRSQPTVLGHTTTMTPAIPEAPSKDEDSHVHYSLDFVDDPDIAQISHRSNPTERGQPDDDAQSNASSSSERNKDSYIEENSAEDPREVHNTQLVVKQDDNSEQTASSNRTNDEPEVITHDEVIACRTAITGPQTNQPKQPDTILVHTQTNARQVMSVETSIQSSSPPSLENDQRERIRPRVKIVREYELERTFVEKKDASTQFTGNHASIQTDLTPDGMLSGTEPRRSREPSASIGDARRNDLPSGGNFSPSTSPEVPSEIRPSDPTVPPPPPSLYATYGLYDPLQLPAATSMSTYKQQLLSLQQQIHQKKLETERLFRDRISSRYTSLRGTDRFLASNRPPRLALWEALLRVDPSLGEAKAKEIARMTNDGAV